MAVLNLSALIAVFAVMFAVVASDSDQTCEIRGHGKLRMYSGQYQRIKMPCKYRASSLQCQGYDIKVSPGQAFDGDSRYYVDTVWITIRKTGATHYWMGRTSTKLAYKAFDKDEDPFHTRQKDMKGADWDIVQEADKGLNTVTLSVSDADFEIVFRPYDHDGKMRAQKKAGITVTCPEATQLQSYPDSICGNETDTKVIKARKSLLNLRSMTQTVLHDVLADNDVVQTNPQCEIASELLNKKCKGGKKAQALKACSPLVNYGKHTSCLSKYHYDPMNIFVYCLRYYCTGDSFSCDLMKDAIQDCNNMHGLSKVKCPVDGM